VNRARRLFPWLVVAGCVLSTAVNAAEIYVFAAASTNAALTEITAEFSKRYAIPAVPVIAASGTLARQIERGAPAHIFISANPAWMEWLGTKQMLAQNTVKTLLGNCLALIQPTRAKRKLSLGVNFPGMFGDDRLAIGDPAYVPAGTYAKAALKSLGLWQDLKRRVARAPSVRHVLALVERGEAAAGLVYLSDARGSRHVRVSQLVPRTHVPPIRYPVAILREGDSAAARKLYDFLLSRTARALFARHGFQPPDGRCSD